jgi:hypothetical protein
MQTIISITSSEWRTVEWDDQAQVWQTVDSGPIVIEATGDAPTIPCALVRRAQREQIVVNH